MDDSTRQQLARLEREIIALRAEVHRRRATRPVRSWLLGGFLIALLALSPLGVLAANFVDLNPGSGHNPNINAIADAGISKGCSDTAHYCPNDLVTREQMASFLARTAGLGGNPPVTNALTAVNATTATNAAQLGGQPASAYQLANQPIDNAVTAQTAVNAQPKYARTVVVRPVGTATENGTALLTALAGIVGSSATNPYLLKIEPGIYDLGGTSLTLQQFVDVEGSGEGITKITHNETANIFAASNVGLRFLTLDCTGGFGCTALNANTTVTNLRLTHVSLTATAGSGAANGLLVQGVSPSILIEDSTITASGIITGSGISVQATTGITLTIRASTIAVTNGSTRTGVLLQAGGNHVVTIEQSRIVSSVATITTTSGNVVRVASSQLSGGATSGSGQITCAGVYDENFAFSASTCP